MKIYLYAIAHPGGFLNIGISDVPRRRLEILQAQEPLDLHLVWALEVPSQRAQTIKSAVHRLLAADRVRGYWFACTLEDFCAVVVLAGVP